MRWAYGTMPDGIPAVAGEALLVATSVLAVRRSSSTRLR